MSDQHPGEPEERLVHSLSPEARRKEARTLAHHVNHRIGPGTRFFEVVKRTLVGSYNDGFIHAGNLAYMAILAIFPFFILGSAIVSLIGEDYERAATVTAVLSALPPMVANVIEPVALNVIDARSGWLLWVGAGVGLWTVSSLIETIREILRRAYGTEATLAFWRYRLFSFVMIIAAVILLIVSLLGQVVISTLQQFIDAFLPRLDESLPHLSLSHIVTAVGIFISIYLLFYTLTPSAYRHRRYPKWPGALLVALWWAAVTIAMPPVLRQFFTYDLTYGSLAGIMIALFFFWLVGLGMVVGAELNAALAVTPEEEAAEDADNEEDDP
ncbi:YihY/virulence factor BrkB family protein [Erythrobacter sp. HKB08]|uniref:YihY/virulence factor BrkB family protein n=1 Tax=Erythrobacter sp. HKB08 TaxID=2502843 RepID=UPI00100896A4|nr:YihY/virulence factor BrkB family protein [Erythrobacter sp. HKB08]